MSEVGLLQAVSPHHCLCRSASAWCVRVCVQHCKCEAKFRPRWNSTSKGNRLYCEKYHPQNWTIIGIGIAVAVLVLVSLGVGIFFLCWHRHLLRLSRIHKKLGPPGGIARPQSYRHLQQIPEPVGMCLIALHCIFALHHCAASLQLACLKSPPSTAFWPMASCSQAKISP